MLVLFPVILFGEFHIESFLSFFLGPVLFPFSLSVLFLLFSFNYRIKLVSLLKSPILTVAEALW